MALYRYDDPGALDRPSLVAALDGWIDAGSASTTAAARLAEDGRVVATFDADALLDFRARRPTLEIQDGHLEELTWPALTLTHARVGGRDLLVLTGAEPDYRWRAFSAAVLELVQRLGVVEWISLGSIPAAVPHTRPVPILGTASRPGLLRGGVAAGPEGRLRVPAAALSVLERTAAEAGVAALGYYAQVPHYVSGPYPAASLALIQAVCRHLDVELPTSLLAEEARQLRTRLDAAAGSEETTRTYVERLEAMVDEARLPSGDELIAEIERFLREGGTEGTQRS